MNTTQNHSITRSGKARLPLLLALIAIIAAAGAVAFILYGNRGEGEQTEPAAGETEAEAVARLTAEAAACNSKDGGGRGDVKLLESITDYSGSEKKFEYDKQNRIVKMCDGGSTTTITYANNLVTVNGKKYVIKGNTITVTEEGSNSTETLTIDKDGYIVRREDNDWFLTNQYQDGNLIEEKHNNGNSRRYGYDDKNSPFSNSNTPKWLFNYLAVGSFIYYTYKNNVLVCYVEGEITGNTQYTYEYDSDGFPIKETAETYSEGEEATSTTLFTYRGKQK
jgi:hypothetical protein